MAIQYLQITERVESFEFVQKLYRYFGVEQESVSINANGIYSDIAKLLNDTSENVETRLRYKHSEIKRTADIMIARALLMDNESGFDDYWMQLDTASVKYENDKSFREVVEKNVEIIMLALEKQKEIRDYVTYPVRGDVLGKKSGII